MKRRTVLLAVGASVVTLAGCTGQGNPETATASPATPDTLTETPTLIRPDGDGPVTRIAVRPAPNASPFRHNLSFLGQPSDDQPVQLRVLLTNPADTEHTVETNQFPLPFPARVGKAANSDETLVLSPGNDAQRSDGCWREYPKTLPKVDTKAVAPGETLAKTYELVNHMEADACWPMGRYRFSQHYTVDPDADRSEYDWWFTVYV